MPVRYDPVLVCLSQLLRAEDIPIETAINRIRESAGNRKRTLEFICSVVDRRDYSKDPLITYTIGLLHVAAKTEGTMPLQTSVDLELIPQERSLLNLEEGEAFTRLVARCGELREVETWVQDPEWVLRNTVPLSQVPDISPSSRATSVLYKLTIGRQIKKARKGSFGSSREETPFKIMRGQAMGTIEPIITKLVGRNAIGTDRLLKTTIAERLVRSYLFHNVADPTV
jgi:hypothetical protein